MLCASSWTGKRLRAKMIVTWLRLSQAQLTVQITHDDAGDGDEPATVTISSVIMRRGVFAASIDILIESSVCLPRRLQCCCCLWLGQQQALINSLCMTQSSQRGRQLKNPLSCKKRKRPKIRMKTEKGDRKKNAIFKVQHVQKSVREVPLQLII